jgi:hypothetical protein
MKPTQVEELILQSLEYEQRGVELYDAALTCALDPDLKEEWERNLAETRTHMAAIEGMCEAMGLDARRETPGRLAVRRMGKSLVEAIETASAKEDPSEAEFVACECVVVAETTDHLDWERLTACAKNFEGQSCAEPKKRGGTIEDREDEQLDDLKRWCRELWRRMQPGLPSVEERVTRR